MKVMKNSIMQCAIAAMACLVCASCTNESESLISQPSTATPAVGKARVKLVCDMDVSVTSAPLRHVMGGSRAALTANGKALTHLYIMDYDKQSGKLLQVLHQTSTAADLCICVIVQTCKRIKTRKYICANTQMHAQTHKRINKHIHI